MLGSRLSPIRLVAIGVWLVWAVSPVVAQVTTRTDAVGKRLNEWFQAGTAAGLGAITYENRDGGHSQINASEWPQLTVYAPSEEEKARNGHMGPAGMVRPGPVIGNCSMSAPALKGGSLPRLYMLQQQGFEFLTNQYLHNNLFIYPEHQDYDPGWNGVAGGWGDLYPANTPYLLITQGSSYQDRNFVRAFLAATAALPPDSQAWLLKNRALMPALQSIFRQSNKMVRKEEDYFTGKAHPPVFNPKLIDEEKFVSLAKAMAPGRIPPVVLLEVVKEDEAAVNGRDFFEAGTGGSEALGTTPCAIARIYRRSAAAYQMTVSARNSKSLQKRVLQFKWVLLQGDPAKVKIVPTTDGTEASISVAWHPEMRAASGIQTHRVDIGVFAHNGAAWSAPSLVTFYMLPNEIRFLDERGRVQEICYENGNPDPGIPPPTDLRWLALGRRADTERHQLAMSLLAKGLSEESLVRLQAVADELAPRQEAWRQLTGDPSKKTEADAAEKKLKEDLREHLEAPAVGGKHSLVEAMGTAIDILAQAPDMYVVLQEELMGLARHSSRTSAVQDIMAARKRLVDWGVFLEQDTGRVELIADEERLTAGDRHHLKQFHLTVLSQAVLPEFLERSVAPAYVDPRLATPKNWRDIHLYAKDGTPIGWMRRANGRRYEFDTEGRLLPEGRGGKAVEVNYSRDTATGKLLFGPK